ncbi:MAG: hypothetical protein IJ156_07205 [Bacteroidales bacterium]|nr:hypothetical protein [Bacteroidales bacterium]
MKVKFTKLAALLLAGAALLAAGCTDYEVDIQKVDKKVDDLAAKTAADLKAQVDALNATISTLETAADHKADIEALKSTISTLESALNGKIGEINGKIQNLETADENFKNQIQDLTTKYNNLEANKADKTELQKVESDLTAAINGEIERAKTAEAALEAAVKKINEETIPAINQQIKDLQKKKLDASTFEDYKKATAKTIGLMQDAIDELAATKLDKEEFNKKVDEIIAKFDDYVLTTTFEEFKKIAATKEELQEVKDVLSGRIKACEDLLAGDWGDQTVKQYIDAKAKKLQDQLDAITNAEGTGRLDVLEKTAEEYVQKVDDIVDELEFAEGDLQGYIDAAAAKALEDAIAYTDEQIAALRGELLNYIIDLYDGLMSALQRIQSVVFVPTHDDLKVNMNVSVMTQTVKSEDGQTKEVGLYIGQPTEVTYKVTPTEYASWLAYYVNGLIGFDEHELDYESDYVLPTGLDKPFAQLLKEYYDYEYPAVFFDTKPLETRADATETEKTPEILICGVTEADDVSGEITFLVYPYGIASPEFVANANKPSYEMDIFDSEGWWCSAATWASGYMDEDYLWGVDDGAYTIGVWKADELKEFMLRKAYATSLTVYVPDHDNWMLYSNEDGLYMDDYVLFQNEVSSTYSVLYPVTTTAEILPEPYKPELDENGEPIVDEKDGHTKLIPAMEEHQELPYSSLRENPVGEKASQDPKGYRVILDGAVPAVKVDGSEPMTLEDAASIYGLVLPEFETAFAGFTYDKGTAEEVDEENFVETDKVYAEIEMNPEKSAAERKLAIGNVITGTYNFTSVLGTFDGWGDVTITKALGEVDVDAKIVWTWENDAVVDHNLFYKTGEEPTIYSRIALDVNVDEEDADYIEKNLDLTINDFAGLEPASLTVTYVDEETGEEVTVEDLVIENVTITEDGKLLADFSNFEWDKVYTITAVYELEAATITVNGTLTTFDRNREKVVIGPIEHTFIVNGEEYYDGYYHWTSDPLYGPIFKAFDENEVINVQDNVDFEYDADQDDFNVSELEGKLKAAADAGTAKGYIDIRNAEETDVYAWTLKSFTSSVLAGDIFSSGERSAEDPNLWLGNTVTRNITTYIGEEVEFQFIFNYKVPDYNFLHLRYYTFNKDKEVEGLIQQRNFADNDGSVIWWTQVNPSYFTSVAEEGTTEDEAQLRESFRHALADYDVSYINLAELAFNVVDEKDEIIDDAKLEELGLNVKFIYTDETQGEKELPKVDQIDPEFLLYESLWVDNTVFYYRTNEKKFIPSLGQLTLTSGDYDFPVATRFEFPKAAVKFPEEVLDYSTYAMVRWTPFQAPVAEGYTIVLDENKVYREPLFKGMYLKDIRPNGVSYDVIKNGEWVIGNVTEWDSEAGTYTKGGNGYVEGVASNDAYHITTDFVYDTTGIPSELKKLLTIEDVQGVPYVVYDYTSEVQFHGVITIPVVVKLENPWQEQIKFVYNVTIKGYGD